MYTEVSLNVCQICVLACLRPMDFINKIFVSMLCVPMNMHAFVCPCEYICYICSDLYMYVYTSNSHINI